MSTPDHSVPSGGNAAVPPPAPGQPWPGTPSQPDHATSGMGVPQGPTPPEPGTGGPQGTPRRRVPLWVYWVIGVVVVALVAGLLIFFFVFKKHDGGAKTPAQAAQRLNENVADKDVLALAGQFSPAEYAPYAQNFFALLKDSKLDKVISGTTEADPTKALSASQDILDAVDLKHSDFKTKVTHSGDHLAAVDVSSWDVDVKVDRKAMEKALKKVAKEQGANSTKDALKELRDADEDDLKFRGNALKDADPLRLVMVKEDSKWFLSPTLSMLETSRLDSDSGSLEPNWKANPEAAKGAKSPEKAFSSLVDEALTSSKPSDLVSDKVLANLALPERRALMLYKPYLAQADTEAQDSLGSMGQLSSLVKIDWKLKSHQVSDRLSIVSMGKTKISIPMAGSLSFNGAKMSLPSGAGSMDLGNGLDQPDRLGFATVKDKGGWRVSLLDSVLNYSSLKANKHGMALGKKFFTEELADSDDDVSWDDLPELGRNSLGVIASFADAANGLNGDQPGDDSDDFDF